MIPISCFSVYHCSYLENGLTVATAEMPHMTSVSVGVWVGIGSRYESASINGACHFIEHMLFKGPRKHSAKEISQTVEGTGGYVKSFTGEETTYFHSRAGHKHLSDLLEVLLDMFLNSTFDAEEVAKERRVIKEEIAMYLDEPQHQVQELLNATLWPGQPLGRPITGVGKTLDALARTNLVTYLHENYLGSNTLIVAAGRVRHAQLIKAVRPFLPRMRCGIRPAFISARNNQLTPRLRRHTRNVEQTQIALGIRTCSRHHVQRYALRLLNAILGENMSSRLFHVVREDHGLAYSIYSTPTFFEDTGDLVISAGLETENLPRTLRLILRELSRLVHSPPNRHELRRACDYLLGQMDLSLESTDNHMNWLGEQLLGFGEVFRPALIKRRLRQVGPLDVRAAAAEFFQPERLNIALVTPLKSCKELDAIIRGFCA